jgi:hypothetical protein
MRKPIQISLLVLMLAYSARAGIMPNGATDPPPPPATTQAADGIMPNGATAQTTVAIVIELLQGVLSLA